VRWVVKSLKLLVAMTVIAFGLSFIVKAQIGQSALTGFVSNIGLIGGWTQGTLLLILNLLFVGGQWVLLKERFKLIHAFQIGLTFAYSPIVDYFIYGLPLGRLDADAFYGYRLLVLVLGVLIMAFGVSLMMTLDFVMMPYEGFANVLAEKLNKPFGSMRRDTDLLFMVGSVIVMVSFSLPNTTLREGTLIFALLMGSFNNFMIPRLKASSWPLWFEN
jgi:uncharacterized membrane protein YczE